MKMSYNKKIITKVKISLKIHQKTQKSMLIHTCKAYEISVTSQVRLSQDRRSVALYCHCGRDLHLHEVYSS